MQQEIHQSHLTSKMTNHQGPSQRSTILSIEALQQGLEEIQETSSRTTGDESQIFASFLKK